MATITANSTQEESIIIGSYNTSYPLDLHSGLLHNFLSESAAIVQKAIYLSGTTTADTADNATATATATATADNTTAATAENTDAAAAAAAADTTFNNLVTFDKSINPLTTMPTDVNYDKLGKFRLNLADCITEHIQQRLVDEPNKPDVYMLIEQSIHVDAENMAYYGLGKINGKSIEMAKYDLTKNNPSIPNDNYGILRRINNINNTNPNLLFDCCTKSADKILTDQKQKFNIMYDNVVNTSTTGVAEGIAIITNNEKFPLNNMLKWKRKELPIPNKLGYGKDKDDKDKDDKDDKDKDDNHQVFFYSDDLGQIIENANNELDKLTGKEKIFSINKQQYYIKKGGLISDMGRPIMLTACLTKQNLDIFIAVHNLNLPQLRAIPVALFKQYTKDLINDNANKTEIAKNFRNIIEADYPKLAELKHDKVSLKTAICEKLRIGMGNFVTSAFTTGVLTEAIPSNITTVKVYMGGDFNDPNKILLNQLSKNGIEFTINKNLYNAKFNFADFGKTCCANADSVSGPTTADTLGGINTDTIYRINGIPNKDKKNSFKYPTNFIDGQNFNFEGDTVSFAIATTTHSTKSVTATPLQGNGDNNSITFSILQPEYTNNTKKVMPSDHYAVMAQFKYPKQGGKRRNYENAGHRSRRNERRGSRNNRSTIEGYSIKRYNVTRRADQKKTRTISHNKNTNKYKKSCNEVRTKKKRRTSRKFDRT